MRGADRGDRLDVGARRQRTKSCAGSAASRQPPALDVPRPRRARADGHAQGAHREANSAGPSRRRPHQEKIRTSDDDADSICSNRSTTPRSSSTTPTASIAAARPEDPGLAPLPGGAGGRDIYYDQRYRHALEMREVLEEILTHADAGDPRHTTCIAEIRRYTKLFWINSGPHNNMTARKFVLKCTPAALRGGGRDRRAQRRRRSAASG